MKRLVGIIIGGVIALAAAASVTDPSARLRLRHDFTPPHVQRRILQLEEDSLPPAPFMPMLILVKDALIEDSLRMLGTIIYNKRNDILLASVLRDSLEQVLKLDGIKNVAASGDTDSDLDLARPYGNVDAAQAGANGLPHGYDGTGVVVGFADIGFDPHHIAFAERVKELYAYNSLYGMRKSATTPEEIGKWVTDSADHFHATHVANILAGGYRGNPYYGVATAADIVATTSALYDPGILAGVEDIISYAKAQGKPAVVNISLSSNLGAHDGTSLLCRYLSACADDAIICISAGNKGKVNGYAGFSLDADNPEGRCFLNTFDGWNGFDVQSYDEIWSRDDHPFQFRFEAYDLDDGKIAAHTDWMGGTFQDDSVKIILEDNPDFAPYFAGQLIAEMGVSSLNNRYCVAMLVDSHTTIYSSKGQWSRYYISLAVRTTNGNAMELDGFCDASLSYFNKVKNDNTTYVGPNGTVNDMCTAQGVISVGNCVTRDTAPRIAPTEGTFNWNVTPDTPSQTSSYSTIPSIPRLPHFCAPGTYVVSALSGPFYEKYPLTPVTAMAAVDGKDYYWFPEMGTSMSSPFTAGTIALWLEAYPELTAAEALEIARCTARTDVADFANPRWSAGCIDAVAGLKKAIMISGIVSTEAKPLVTVTPDRRLDIINPANQPVRVFNLSGVTVDSGNALTPGLYMVSIGTYSQKILVR